MLYTILIITINAFVNVEICFLVIIYKHKVYVFRVIYFCLNVISLQLLYY